MFLSWKPLIRCCFTTTTLLHSSRAFSIGSSVPLRIATTTTRTALTKPSFITSSTTTTTTTTSTQLAMSTSATPSTTTNDTNKPLAIVVQATIDPNRLDEFLPMIENNALQSRKEPGCYRFDVLRDPVETNQFIFYELYEDANAIEYHKQQPHYQAWADFKASGGTLSSVTFKHVGECVSL